jgi:hypothetical protein
MLFEAGKHWLNSDYAPGILVADEMRSGRFSAFYFGMDYGGVTLGVPRALWSACWDWLGGNHLSGHMAFTYGVSPALLAGFAFLAARAYVSLSAAIVVGFITAIGSEFWVHQYGNDIYIAYLLFGFALLAWRASLKNPFYELSLPRLFLAGTVCGLAAYTSRISLIYVVAFFIPPRAAFGELRSLFEPRDLFARIVRGSAVFLFGLFVYLEIFGADLGVLFGRSVKIHASPNLSLAALFMVILWLRQRWKTFTRAEFTRAVLLFGGFLVGMLPELLHWLNSGLMPPAGLNRTYSFDVSMGILGRTPLSLRDLFSPGASFGRNASIVLVLGGIFGLVRSWRDGRRGEAVIFAAVLSVAAYCRVYSYDIAPVRYLLPVVPAVLVGIGFLCDRIFARGPLVIVCALVVLITHFWAHLSHRFEAAKTAVMSGEYDRVTETVRYFRDAKVEVVVTDNYWQSNQYAVVSGMMPPFVTTEKYALRSPRALEVAARAEQLGILVSQPKGKRLELRFARMLDRDLALSPLASVGETDLYLGKVVKK